MSGGTFRVHGRTGPAPTTVWFGKMPDRFTALAPGYIGNNDTNPQTSFFSARYVNTWVPYNQIINGAASLVTAGLGPFTTAPDETTNTAQKITESATNTIHAVQAAWNTLYARGQGFSFRISVFAKAAERTRFAIYMSNILVDVDHFASGAGCKTVFDLANGTVAVANTAFNTGGNVDYTPLGAEIVPFGDGWYRCSMDCMMGAGSGNNSYSFAIYLDNGSGSAPESTKYAGDGSSGVYFWQASALPPMAWSINSEAFFDDFTTLDHFDMAGTLDPTKTWWLRNQWPAFGGNTPGLTPTDPTKLSITEGTKLKIATNAGQPDLTVMSAVWTGGTNYTASQVFSPPMLTECSMSWDDVFPVNEGPTWWSAPISRLIDQDPAAGPFPTGSSSSGEVDFFEFRVGGGGADPRMSCFYGPMGGSASVISSSVRSSWGPQKWHTARQFATGQIVAYNGNLYQALVFTTGEQPDITPASWLPRTAAQAGYPSDWVAFDFETQNTYSVLWIPYVRGDLGHLMTFCNDIYCPIGHVAYGPDLLHMGGPPPDDVPAPLYTSDGQTWPMMIGSSQNLNMYTDWVRIMK